MTGEPCRPDELRTLVAAILAAAWRSPQQSRRPRGNRPVRPGGSSSVITLPTADAVTRNGLLHLPRAGSDITPRWGPNQMHDESGRRGQAAGRGRAGRPGRPTPGRAPDLARIRRVRHDERVAAADVAKDSGMVCTRTRPGPAPGAAPCGRQGPGGRGPPAGPSAQGRRDRDGDAGINQRLGAFAGPVGYSLRWASRSAGPPR